MSPRPTSIMESYSKTSACSESARRTQLDSPCAASITTTAHPKYQYSLAYFKGRHRTPSFGLLDATIRSCIACLFILFGVRKLARPQLYGRPAWCFQGEFSPRELREHEQFAIETCRHLDDVRSS
jgi:hypothetical protein